MTAIDYLRKHPLDFVLVGNQARIRMFVCPIKEGGCDDHPVLQLNEPADQPEDDSAMVPFNEVAGALGWLLRMSATIVIDEVAWGSARETFLEGGFEIAAAAVKFHNEMTAAIERSKLN